jgi:hypothetical protein
MSIVEQNMQTLKAENDRLERKLYFKEREVKDLQKELDNASTLIDELTAKNAELQRLLDSQQSNTLQSLTKQLTASEFQSLLDAQKDVELQHGLEAEWQDVMVAFSDPIFWEQNYPDIVLFRDDEHRCYRTLDDNIEVKYPISQGMLEILGWEHVRPITDEESVKIINNYDL